MTSAARNDIFLGAGAIGFAAFLSLYLLPLGIVLPGNTETRALAPDFWPTIIVEIAGLAGVCLVVHGWINRRNAPNSPAALSGLRDKLAVAARVGVAFGAMFACYWLVPVLGLVAGAIALCAFLMVLGGERRPQIIVPVSIILPVLLYLFFAGFAGVPIPTGVFEGVLEGAN